MNVNPTSHRKVEPALPERSSALRDLRLTMVILYLPGVYNIPAFNFSAEFAQFDEAKRFLFRATNALGFIGLHLAVWFIGLTLLECITGGSHAIFARRSELTDWK